jgi:hypothetical protein
MPQDVPSAGNWPARVEGLTAIQPGEVVLSIAARRGLGWAVRSRQDGAGPRVRPGDA